MNLKHSESRVVEQSQRSVRPWAILISLYFLCVGGPFFIPLIRSIWFVPVNATITEAAAVRCGDNDGYALSIRFRYIVEGHVYSNGHYRYDVVQICESMDHLQPILDHYSVGDNVEAWYDPNDPNIAVLSRGLNIMHVVILMTGGGFLIVFAFAYWVESVSQ